MVRLWTYFGYKTSIYSSVQSFVLESVRQSLISGGAVANLVGSLSFQDSSVRASTAKALGMLACDHTARQQVIVVSLPLNCAHFQL